MRVVDGTTREVTNASVIEMTPESRISIFNNSEFSSYTHSQTDLVSSLKLENIILKY
jgi:hypothetical protein